MFINSDQKIDLSLKKSLFTNEKETIFKIIFDETILLNYYEKACEILEKALNNYLRYDIETITNILKLDNFDSDYLNKTINRALKKKS